MAKFIYVGQKGYDYHPVKGKMWEGTWFLHGVPKEVDDDLAKKLRIRMAFKEVPEVVKKKRGRPKGSTNKKTNG